MKISLNNISDEIIQNIQFKNCRKRFDTVLSVLIGRNIVAPKGTTWDIAKIIWVISSALSCTGSPMITACGGAMIKSYERDFESYFYDDWAPETVREYVQQ